MRFDGFGATALVAWTVFAAIGPAPVALAADQKVEAPEPRVSRFARQGGAALTRLRLAIHKSETVRLPHPIDDIRVGSAEILDVIPLNPRMLYVLGKRLGTSNISLFDKEGQLLGVIDIEVGLDHGTIAEKVADATGPSGIRVRTQGDRIVLTGTAADAPTVDRAVQVATALAPGGVINTTRVASPQQVMLKVRFVEVNRTAGRELGLRFEHAGRRSAIRSGETGALAPVSTTGPSGVGLLTDVVPALLPTSALGALGPPFGQAIIRLAGDSRRLDLFISALEARGLARRLAEPNLVALSGDSAEFHAGGEIPIPVAATTSGGFPTITIAYKEFGVRLGFTPTVLSNGLINIRLEPEVSDIDPSIAIPTGAGVSVPGLMKRRAKSTIELRDGQSFAFAGLLQNVTDTQIEQLPWLGSIPVLGALFRSTSYRQRETELVVIVTPHLVKPAKPGAIIETPLDSSIPANDVDLFLGGKLEVEKRGRGPVAELIAKKGPVLGPHGHILVSTPSARAVESHIVRAKN